MWLDAKDVNGDGLSESASNFLSVGNKTEITTWGDRSGNANTLTQGLLSPSILPVYVVQNGSPSLHFGGLQGNSGAYMSKSMPSSLSGSNGFTLIVAAQTFGSAQGRIMQFGANSGAGGQLTGLAQSGSFFFNNGSKSYNANLSSASSIAVFRRASGATYAESELILNGTTQIGNPVSGSSVPNLPSSAGELLLGTGRGSNAALADPLAAGIKEVMLFSGALDDFAVRRAEGYLAWKWGTQSSLPSSHPFKTSRPVFGGSQSISLSATNLGTDPSDNKKFTSIFDSPFILEGSYATSGLPLVYTTSNSSVMEVASGKLNPLAGGEVTVTVSQPGNNRFAAATSKTMVIKILSKRPQTVTFGSIAEQSIQNILDLNASASSGLPVTFELVSSPIASLVGGNKLKFSGLGQVTVKAKQVGNSEYITAVPVTQTFEVKKPMLLIFDPIGDMGRSQTFPVRAKAFDALTRKPIPVTPSFSITAGPATVNGQTVTTGSTIGQVTIQASAVSSSYKQTIQTQTFNVNTKQGQWIVFKQGEKGGLRDLPLSRKAIPLGRFASSHTSGGNNGLAITYSLHSQTKTALKLVGNGANAKLHFTSAAEGFSGFGTDDEITVMIKATVAGNSQFNAAADVIREVKIMKPSRKAWLEERRWDTRYDSERDKFAKRILAKKQLNGLDDLNGDSSIDVADARLLFDSDGFDSDGDGVSNLLERAFGGDSLTSDRRMVLPRIIKKKDGKQRITFLRYQVNMNTEGIQYVVERSKDLRRWTSAGIVQLDLNGGAAGKGKDVGGGFERVVYESSGTAKAGGGKQFLRVRIRTK
jgi:hypothetical protein